MSDVLPPTKPEVSRGRDGLKQVQEVLYTLCSQFCDHSLGMVAGFHRGCYDVSKSACTWLSAVNEYDFDPFPESSFIDEKFLRHRLTNVVARSYPLLPPELCHYTADYVATESYLRYCSISNGLALKGVVQPGSQVIDLSCDVWATTVVVQNRIYYASLSNTNRGPAKVRNQALLHSSTAENPADTIYVARDAWGIKKIQFAQSGEVYDMPESAGVWWQTLPIRGGQLIVKNDGLKLRSVHCINDDEATNSAKTWYSTPQPLSLRIWAQPLPKELSRPMQRTTVVLNKGNAKGIMVGLRPNWDTFCLRMHLSDDDFVLYSTFERKRLPITWIYVPLGRGEQIREIWLRKHRKNPFPLRRSALILVTSAGRTCVPAEHPPPGFESEYTYHLAADLSQQPGTIFLGWDNKGLQDVAFSLPPPQPLDGPSLPSLPSPASPFPRSMATEQFCYSRAELSDVTEAIPCRMDGIIKGILLRYRDGRLASLGQVRLDRLDKAEMVSQHGMWFQISQSAAGGFPQVTGVRVKIPSTDSGDYFHVKRPGYLEWWSSRRQCQLCYNGSRYTMATRL